MGCDPLFPMAAFLPLAADLSTAQRAAAISWTERDPLIEADDYTHYHNESDTV
jgi:hypothetical protein